MARIAKVLEAAEHMLEEVGPEKTSIPALAEVTGVPRAAIYPFFPDKYALFSHLALSHMDGLTKALAPSAQKPARDWREWVEAAIGLAADYYNAHPAASILLLRGAFPDSDRAAHEAKNTTLGTLFRAKAMSMGALPTLPVTPDATTIGLEIAFACMKHGYASEGRVSPEICREASRAVIAYLSSWDET
ncbi:TetR/AcrR family transcriptional regulator [Paraburkholderia sp. UYCP14C]|uniref:TetR/AcrR family transcriptional regulator n=1 Tax=Paraburkholderia sp. UYCP14C TaxID=2511130 RepID=UPI001B7D5E37|nr:TetR/AcrR family transcriptional regulator [Paraburkholderia sp. UYCP14C]